jgi:hypothetical protein
MLKIKWTGRITNDEVFQRAKEERLLLKLLTNRCHSWIGRTVGCNEFVVDSLEGAMFGGKKDVKRAVLRYFKQVARNRASDNYTEWRERLAAVPDGKVPTNQKIEG